MTTPESPNVPNSTPSKADHPAVGLGSALGIGLVAGLLACVAGELAEWSLTPAIASEFVVSGSQQFAARAAALARKAAVANGLLGAALGLGLGWLGGRARVSSRGTLVGSAVGGALGAVAGAVASLALIPWFVRNEQPMADDLILPLLMHGGIAAALGAAAGLGLGLGLGGPAPRVARAVLGGLLGGAIGAALFQVLGALVFPTDQTAQPIATSVAARVVGRSLVPIAVVVLAVLGTRPAAPRRANRTAARHSPDSGDPATG